MRRMEPDVGIHHPLPRRVTQQPDPGSTWMFGGSYRRCDREDVGRPGIDVGKRGVLYQVYPRSFQDSDDDGVGDLRGVIQRLDHLAWLGVDGIWLNPADRARTATGATTCPTTSAWRAEYGGLDALQELIEAASDRGIRIVLDLVPNHTSDQHTWFLDARPGRNAEHRDWYVWADPATDGGPPEQLAQFLRRACLDTR